jgi:hypothetical protein
MDSHIDAVCSPEGGQARGSDNSSARSGRARMARAGELSDETAVVIAI